MAGDAAAHDVSATSTDENALQSTTANELSMAAVPDEVLKSVKEENAVADAQLDEAVNTNGESNQLTQPVNPTDEPGNTDFKDVLDEPAEGKKPGALQRGTNGTPTASRKTTNGSAKKKSSVIPEHKSKKLNKKKSKTTLHLGAKPGDLYLASLKGHPPWPSIVCDEEMLPEILLKKRPVTAAQPDGTFKKPEYAEGGKRANERTFAIMFLKTNEFSWIPNTELTPVTAAQCKEASEKGKSKTLVEAFEIAAEGRNLAYFKEMLVQHSKAMEEDIAEKEEREANKAKKVKRKSDGIPATIADEDEMDVDNDGADAKPKSKKRKKSLDSDELEGKPAKTPKTATKLKLSTPKTPVVVSSSKKKAPKPKSSGKKSVAKVNANASDEELVDTPRVEEKPLTPAEAKEKKEKEIRYYRHKLQRGFLSRDTVPDSDEIKAMSGFLNKLEAFPDLEGVIIRATKINKVLKAMIRLTSIPSDEDYQFKKRSHELLSKWNKILQTEGAVGDNDDSKVDASIVNGADKDHEDETIAEAEASEATILEKRKEASSGQIIGTTTEGDEEAGKAADDLVEKVTNDRLTDEEKINEADVDKALADADQAPTEALETTSA